MSSKACARVAASLRSLVASKVIDCAVFARAVAGASTASAAHTTTKTVRKRRMRTSTALETARGSQSLVGLASGRVRGAGDTVATSFRSVSSYPAPDDVVRTRAEGQA